jgi:hypothetical protein
LTTGLRRIEERAYEEREWHGREAKQKQQAQNGAEVGIVKEPTHGEDRTQERQKKPENDSIGNEVADPVSEVGQTHHSHRLLQAGALLKHNLHYQTLHEYPKRQRNQKRL